MPNPKEKVDHVAEARYVVRAWLGSPWTWAVYGPAGNPVALRTSRELAVETAEELNAKGHIDV